MLQVNLVTSTNANSNSNKLIQNKLSPDKTIALHNIHPTGLTFDGKYVWATDKDSNKIYQLNQTNNGSVIQSFSSPGYYPRGLTYDGIYLWLSAGNNSASELYKMYTPYKRVEARPTNPGINLWGLAFNGNYIWSVDYTSHSILKIDPSNPSSAVTQYPILFTNSSDLRGLVYINGYLWLSDATTNKIYKLQIGPKDLTEIGTFNSPANDTNGLAYDGNYLWIADGTSHLYSIIPPKDLSSPSQSLISSNSTSLEPSSTDLLIANITNSTKSSHATPGFTLSLIFFTLFAVIVSKRLRNKRII